MPVLVSLLRGVNVGGHHTVKMDDLRSLYESLGLRNVETFILSGNVIFSTAARDRNALAKRLEAAIEKKFGFPCDVVLRSAGELRDALARNPFAERPEIDPAKLLITFLSGDPDPEGAAKVRALDIAPEELQIDGREVYVYFANGMARPKLQWQLVGKLMKAPGTGRNLNTVRKLLAHRRTAGVFPMNRACSVFLIAAALLVDCGPSAPPAKTASADPTTESWYADGTKRLTDLDRAAAQLFQAGRTQEAEAIVTSAQALQTKLLAAPRPTFEAMEAIADFDRIYGKMLISNGYFGEARMLFMKNVTRWKTWKPQTPETERRLKEAAADIAECDKHMGG